MKTNEAIRLVLKQQRKFLKMNQVQLAEAVGLHRTSIERAESGKKDIYVGTLEAIVDGLDLGLSDFFEMVEEAIEAAEVAHKAITVEVVPEVADLVEGIYSAGLRLVSNR